MSNFGRGSVEGSSDLSCFVCRERGTHRGGGKEAMVGKPQRRTVETTLCRGGSVP